MNIESIRVTIVTPVYNGEDYIFETMRSVTNAMDKSCEYIVIDDGSTDSSRTIVEEFQSIHQIQLISTVNCGESSAVNLGLKYALGKYIVFVNADDLIEPDLIKTLANKLDEKPELGCVYPDWKIIDSKGDFVQHVITKTYNQTDLLAEFDCMPGPGALVRTELLREIGGRNRNLRYISDFDMFIRLSYKSEFERVPLVLASWRRHDAALSSESGSSMAKEIISYSKSIFKSNPQNESSQILRKMLGSAYFRAATLSIRSPKIPGLRYLVLSFFYYPNKIRKTRTVLFLSSGIFGRYLLFGLRKLRIIQSF